MKKFLQPSDFSPFLELVHNIFTFPASYLVMCAGERSDILPTIAELDRMSQIEINEANRTQLVDIQTIKIDPLQSATQRMESYLEQIKNPYLYLCGDTAVRIRFEPDEKPLANRLKSYFISIKTC